MATQADWLSRMEAAFQAGNREREEALRRTQEQEERKLRMDALRNEQSRLKHQQAVQDFLQRYQFKSSQPATAIPNEPMAVPEELGGGTATPPTLEEQLRRMAIQQQHVEPGKFIEPIGAGGSVDLRTGKVIPPTQKPEEKPREPQPTAASLAAKAAAGDEEAARALELLQKSSQEAGSYIPLYDEQDRIVGAWNPKAGNAIKVPQEFSGTRKSGLSSTELTARGQMELMLDELKTLREFAEKHKDAIGYVQGKVVAGERLVGVGKGTDPEVIEMFRIADNLADVLLRARSGAQVNEQEYKRLRVLMPNPRLSEAKFFSDLDAFEKEAQATFARRTGKAKPPAGGGESTETAPAVGGIFNGKKILKVEKVK